MKPLALFALFVLLLISFSSHSSTKNKTLSVKVYQQLQKINALQNKGQSKDALKRLKLLANKTDNATYNGAIINQQLAYAYLNKDPHKAKNHALKALQSKQLPLKIEQSMRLMLAQIAYTQTDYNAVIQYTKQWLAQGIDPDGKIHFLAGYGAFQLKRYTSAEKQLKKALKYKKTPKEWQKILLSVYLESSQYAKAEIILIALISRHKEAKWWHFLASVYLRQHKNQKALAVLILAYQQGILPAKQFLNLIRLYQQRGLPEKAARMLSHALTNNKITNNYQNNKILFQLWYAAREHKKASQALQKATLIKHKGEDYALLGQLYIEQAHWLKARKMLEIALQKGVKSKAQIRSTLDWLAAQKQRK